jgi:hypothetical protein
MVLADRDNMYWVTADGQAEALRAKERDRSLQISKLT